MSQSLSLDELLPKEKWSRLFYKRSRAVPNRLLIERPDKRTMGSPTAESVMSKFVVIQDSYGYVTRQGDPNDQWDRDDTAAHLSVAGVQIAQRYFDVALPTEYDPSKPLFLVWADYDTGDSFGRDCNRFEAVDIFQDQERATSAKAALEKGQGYTRKYTRDDGKKIDYSCPWDGYFEYLNAIHVEEVRIVE
jgi:hypothetical protein